MNSEADGVDFDPGDGVCEVNDGGGDCTLRAAVLETNALGGTHQINLPEGVFTLTIAGEDTISEVGDLDVIGTELTLAGAGVEETVIDGNGIDRVMSVNAPDVVVRDLTIRNGAATVGSVLGGAISMIGGPNPNTLFIQRVHFLNNSANAGGALFAPLGKTVTIEDSLFTENTTVPLGVTNQNGAAIYCNGCALNISGSTFAFNREGNKTLTVHTDAVLNVVNSTLSDNEGGGIRTQNADAVIKFSTLANNGAQNLSNFTADDTRFIQIGNSVLQHSDSDNCQSGDLPISLGYNVSNDESCGLTGTGDLQNTDALLEPLQNNWGPTDTRAAADGSPVIDRVPPADCTDAMGAALDHDQRGFERPVNTNCDAGAVEHVQRTVFDDGFETD